MHDLNELIKLLGDFLSCECGLRLPDVHSLELRIYRLNQAASSLFFDMHTSGEFLHRESA